MNKEKSIIIIDPDETFSAVLRAMLAKVDETFLFQAYTDALSFLEDEPLDPRVHYIFIIHSYAGSFRSSQLIDEIKGRIGNDKNASFIFSSDNFDEMEAIEAFDKGADYYLVKPVNLNILIALLKKLLREV